MPTDHIRYDILVQEALRGMVRTVLTDAAKNGLPGEHHFFITFDTTAEGVRLSQRMRAQYPEEMTVVLQHQFWDLNVTDDLSRSACRSAAFRSGLSCRSRRSSVRRSVGAVRAAVRNRRRARRERPRQR